MGGRLQPEGRGPPSHTIGILADPAFATDDQRIRRLPSTAPQGETIVSSDTSSLAKVVQRSAKETGARRNGDRLVRLTGTRKEAEGILALVADTGAARVVVSLWGVSDQATADLMVRFYRGILKEGKRPAEALRAAQLELWNSDKWKAPYYWAAFVMYGEWR